MPFETGRRLFGDASRPSARGGRSINILLISEQTDDVALVRELLARCRDDATFTVVHANSIRRALARLTEIPFQICVLDAAMADGDEVPALVSGDDNLQAPVILLGEAGQAHADVVALELGFADYLDREELDPARLSAAIRMATVRHEQARLSEHARRRDAHSGLPDASIFRDRIEHALHNARRRHNHLAVMLVDIGQPASPVVEGAEAERATLLRSLAAQLRGVVRSTDTIAHVGGARFGVLVEDLAEQSFSTVIARKLLSALCAPPAAPGAANRNEASFRIGVAVFPQDGEDPGSLLQRAAIAMQTARAADGGRCSFADPRLDERLRHSLALDADLHDALQNGKLALLFQPQVALHSAVVGVSAVPEWSHPQLGRLSGERLRSLVIDTQLGEAATDWLIAAVSRQIREWQGLRIAPSHVSVNLLARRALRWSGLPALLERVMAREAIAPAMIELELEEELLLDELRHGGATLKALKDLGVRVGVGGFGSGSLALSILRDAPLDTIRLSADLLTKGSRDGRRLALARAVIQAARELGIRVVAEAVGDEAELAMLHEQRVDAVQSAARCPPLPRDACIGWLEQATAQRSRQA